MRLQLLFTVLLSFYAATATAAPAFIAAPYKHLAINQTLDHVITFAHDGKARPYLDTYQGALVWAFATGECGDEKWGDADAQQVADANVAAFDKAHAGYIISTGGQGGIFTCASDAGMERFIARYASPNLLGLDFDIEAGQSATQVDALMRSIAHAQRKHPTLRISFTVATHAASDGSMRSLNAQAESVLRAVRRHAIRKPVFNLMVMDYGPAQTKVCVMRGDVCDMGRSAIQAATNAHRKYGIPYAQIALTPMIGMNDEVTNVFSVSDASMLADAAARMKLAGLHFWSLDRDTPCAAPVTAASASCSGVDASSGAFTRALAGARP